MVIPVQKFLCFLIFKKAIQSDVHLVEVSPPTSPTKKERNFEKKVFEQAKYKIW